MVNTHIWIFLWAAIKSPEKRLNGNVRTALLVIFTSANEINGLNYEPRNISKTHNRQISINILLCSPLSDSRDEQSHNANKGLLPALFCCCFQIIFPLLRRRRSFQHAFAHVECRALLSFWWIISAFEIRNGSVSSQLYRSTILRIEALTNLCEQDYSTGKCSITRTYTNTYTNTQCLIINFSQSHIDFVGHVFYCMPFWFISNARKMKTIRNNVSNRRMVSVQLWFAVRRCAVITIIR